MSAEDALNFELRCIGRRGQRIIQRFKIDSTRPGGPGSTPPTAAKRTRTPAAAAALSHGRRSNPPANQPRLDNSADLIRGRDRRRPRGGHQRGQEVEPLRHQGVGGTGDLPDPREEEEQEIPLKIIFLNALSIISKIDHLNVFINDILCITDRRWITCFH